MRVTAISVLMAAISLYAGALTQADLRTIVPDHDKYSQICESKEDGLRIRKCIRFTESSAVPLSIELPFHFGTGAGAAPATEAPFPWVYWKDDEYQDLAIIDPKNSYFTMWFFDNKVRMDLFGLVKNPHSHEINCLKLHVTSVTGDYKIEISNEFYQIIYSIPYDDIVPKTGQVICTRWLHASFVPR